MTRLVIDRITQSGGFSLLLFCILAICGCTRAPIPDYVLIDELNELPERHRDQIASFTKEVFGTPLNPRLAAVADEAAIEESEAEEGDAAGEGAEAGPQLVELVDRRLLAHGANVYRRRCAGCHGVSGDGNGDAAPYLQPKPRDYRKGIFKFTSTPYGLKPTRADLIRTIRRGAKGTSMPAFPWMTEEDIEAVIDYVISLSQRGEFEYLAATLSEDYEEDEDIDTIDLIDSLDMIQSRWQTAADVAVQPISSPPPYADESIIAGRKAFLAKGCSKCHGEDGKGQTEWLSHEFLAKQESLPAAERAEINYDAWGDPAPAANITAGMLHGGRRQLDIYRRIFTGINGTPMPSFGQTLVSEPETIWNMVHYVQSIVEGREVDFGEMTTDATAESTEATGESADTTGESVDATDDSTDATDESADTTDTTDEPADATGEPADTTGEPADTTDEPADTTDESVDTTDESADTTDEPADATDESADTTDEPADATHESVDTTDEPADETDESADTAADN